MLTSDVRKLLLFCYYRTVELTLICSTTESRESYRKFQQNQLRWNSVPKKRFGEGTESWKFNRNPKITYGIKNYFWTIFTNTMKEERASSFSLHKVCMGLFHVLGLHQSEHRIEEKINIEILHSISRKIIKSRVLFKKYFCFIFIYFRFSQFHSQSII